MSRFVNTIGNLFDGGNSSAERAASASASVNRAEQDRQIAQQRDAQSIALNRQQQDAQQQDADLTQRVGRAGRLPRGRRLLLAATGETGVSNKLG